VSRRGREGPGRIFCTEKTVFLPEWPWKRNQREEENGEEGKRQGGKGLNWEKGPKTVKLSGRKCVPSKNRGGKLRKDPLTTL